MSNEFNVTFMQGTKKDQILVLAEAEDGEMLELGSILKKAKNAWIVDNNGEKESFKTRTAAADRVIELYLAEEQETAGEESDNAVVAKEIFAVEIVEDNGSFSLVNNGETVGTWKTLKTAEKKRDELLEQLEAEDSTEDTNTADDQEENTEDASDSEDLDILNTPADLPDCLVPVWDNLDPEQQKALEEILAKARKKTRGVGKSSSAGMTLKVFIFSILANGGATLSQLSNAWEHLSGFANKEASIKSCIAYAKKGKGSGRNNGIEVPIEDDGEKDDPTFWLEPEECPDEFKTWLAEMDASGDTGRALAALEKVIAC